MDNTYTEGIERFKKVVDFMGLYVPEDEQLLIDQNMLEESDEYGDYPAVHAYVNKECYEGQRGFLLACQDEAVYMCLEAQYDGENLYCEGSVPSWTYSDEMLIQHLGDMVKEYKKDLVKKRKRDILMDFEPDLFEENHKKKEEEDED